ncbi:hypothetical protein Q4512_08085 [Oceanihabitans sp. 2_MG-2023]|uniref:hypothetical protein n=1 Tax=Oceanihabitans sp. 2_MG-2023 TaxID=3062661 RepID=UPI0026E37CAA|nr:hypothetical protein [Oceanihabitans sp. 2_MG-2023]MDO6596872.1 hypothetical protein [Oceanihabitans sp. 2_MG-2023]
MEPSYNFKLNTLKPVSKSCIALGLTDFNSVCKFVKQLPYGRNTDRSNYESILQENKGTCATKHAFLKEIAIENEATHIQFCLCIYKMNEANTKGVDEVLSKLHLEYIPEAHTYLKMNNEIFDFTRTKVSTTSFKEAILFEEKILPKQIGNYKLEFHKNYIKKWIISNHISYSFEEIWSFREACIQKLSN